MIHDIIRHIPTMIVGWNLDQLESGLSWSFKMHPGKWRNTCFKWTI